MIDRLRCIFRFSFIGLLLIGLVMPLTSCISSPSLTSITVTPATMNFGGPGLTTQLTATGSYTHPNHPAILKNITDQVTWASATPGCVTVSATGLITSQNATCSNITVSASAKGFPGTITGSMTVNVTGAISPSEPITALAIVPSTLSVASAGQTGQFIALGTVGTTSLQVDLTKQVAWTSSSSAVATIGSATGLATAAGAGTTNITALWTNPDGTAVPATAAFTVTGAVSGPLLSLSILPNTQTMAAGQTSQLIAIGTFNTSPTSQNLTNSVTWSSSNTSVASISSSGLVTAVSQGTAAITAVATNPGGGVVTATATFTVSAASTVEPLVSIAIVPASQTALAVNQTAQFVAIGTTSSGATVNLTNQSATIGSATVKAAAWNSSDTAVATIDPATGIATSLSAGTTAITASATNPDGSVVIASAVYTVTVPAVTEPVVSMAVTPAAQTLTIVGQQAGLIAIGTTGTGSTVNLTNQNVTIGGATVKAAVWNSSNKSVATVDPNTGVVTAVAAGSAAVTAIAANPDGTVVVGTATITVSIPTVPEPLASLAIVPATQSASGINQTAQFIAIGTTASGITVNLTNQTATIGTATIKAATWTSSSKGVATIDPATGIATSTGAGTTAITASATNPDGSVVIASAVYTVTVSTSAEPLVSIAISPASQTLVAVGQTANLTALATTGSGATVNLTNKTATVGSVTIPAAVWSSSNPSAASVDPATGVVTATGIGVTAIMAIGSNPDGSVVTGTATITSTASGAAGGAIASITVIPAAQAVASPGQTTQFFAIGTTTTGATVNLTTDTHLAWSSSSTQIAIVGSNTGFATAKGQGIDTITALYTPASGNVVTGTATFTVAGGTTETYVSPLTILPGTQTVGSGQTAQFIALATLGSNGNVVDVTNSSQLAWKSSIASIASVSNYPTSPAGVVSGLSAGDSTITAELTNPDNTVVSASATVTVTTSTPPEDILTLTIYPKTITVLDFQLTGQFLAIGTYSQKPYVRDVTNSPSTTWISSEPEIFPVGTNSGGSATASAGLVTAIGSGSADIIAESVSADQTIQIAQATFSCPYQLPLAPNPGSCFPGETVGPTLLETLTVYNEGLDTKFWEVTAPSATATPDVIHCGPGWSLGGGAGGSVCTATYPENTTVILTAPATSSAFGGWSFNCTPSDANGNALPGPVYWTSTGPNYCKVVLNSNDTVGAIFN